MLDHYEANDLFRSTGPFFIILKKLFTGLNPVEGTTPKSSLNFSSVGESKCSSLKKLQIKWH